MSEQKTVEMLSLRETAKRTGLSYGYLRRLCLNGEIIHVRCGKKFLVNFDRLVEMLNRGELHNG